jgi:hypothetical protein
MFFGHGAILGDNFVCFMYVFIEEFFQNSYSGFIFILFLMDFLLSFRNEITRSFQVSVGDSFDNIRRSRWFILDVPWIINKDHK